MAVGAGVANAFNAQVAITEAVAVRVRVVRVGADDALVGVGHAVVVVVLVLNQRVGLNARVGVVVGQLVGQAVAVKVLEHLKPERGFNREGRVGRVRPNRVGRVVHRLGRRAGDDTGRGVEHQAFGQVGGDFPRGAENGVGRVDRRRLCVVHQDGWTERARTNGVRVWTGQANRWHGVGAVADAITVGVGVQGIRTEVASTVVDARARFRQVGCTVAVVVQVFDQLTVFGVVLGQFVGQAITVGVLQNFEVEGEEQAASGGVAVHRVFCFRDDFGRRSADDTGDGVNGDARRQSRMDFVGAIRDGVLRRKRNHQRVVERIDGAFGRLTQRRLVRTGHTDGRHGVGAVADTVVVGVGVERVGTGVAFVHVGARPRFVHVVQTVAVVVLVLHQRWNARRIAVDGVGHAVAVRVGVGRRVEREGVRTGRTHAAHGVGAVAHAVAVRVGVGRAGARVTLVHVGARVRFVGVGQAVSVVVKVLYKARGIGVARIVIAGQFVWQAVAVAVLQNLNREVPR